MDKGFMKTQMMRLEANYGMEKFKITKEVYELWLDMFKDVDEKGFEASVNEYIRKNEFPPTVASIMKIYITKKELRDSTNEYIVSIYQWLARWFEEEPSSATYEAFRNIVCVYPLPEVKGKVDIAAQELVGMYNACIDSPEKITLKEALEKVSCKLKDN